MALNPSKKILKLVNEDIDVLVDTLRIGFTTAQSHKTSHGVSGGMLEDVYQVNSTYSPEMQGQISEANEPDIFFPLGALKSRAQYSWVRDVVAGSLDKMWTLEPTPIVELPPTSRDNIRREVLADMAGVSDLQAVSFSTIEEFVSKATDEEMDRLYEEAQEKADRMSRKILDQWDEGGWEDVWSEVVNDLGTYPVSIIKGPVEVNTLKGSWSSDGKFKETYEVKPIMYRVAPENWYPLPDVGHNPSSGSGVFELATMSRAELITARDHKDYNKQAVEETLEAHPDGWTEGDSDWMKVKEILKRSDESEGNDELGAGIYNIIKYYGMIKIELLREHVKKIASSIKDEEYHECEIWMIDDKVIYAVLNPNPLKQRPFSVIPRQFVAGSAWGGDSLQKMLETPQRIVNALVRQHIINMGFAAQPIGEVEASRVPGGKPPKQIRAGRIYPVLPSLQGTKAYRFTELQSKSTEYLNAMDYYITKADDLSGIPGYIIGSPGAESQSTLGQTNFYYSNASKGIGALLSLIDRFLIVPMLERYYVRNMISLDDDTMKGDASINAKGLSGVFENQVKQDQSTQVIQMLTQLKEVMPSYITEESFLEIVKPLLRSIGLDIDDVLKQNPQQGPPQQGPVPQQGQPPAGPVQSAGPQPPTAAPVTPESINQNVNVASTPSQTISTET